jgi:N-acetylmuramoyl-L-alanine amidase
MAIKIMIDAGHYKNYNRSCVYSPYYEGNMTFKLQGYLKTELEKYGFVVGVTKTSVAQDVTLYSRGYKAKGYDVFLSLHSNACDSESVDRVVIIKGYDQGDKLAKRFGEAIQEVMGTKQEYQVYTRKNSSGGEYYGVLRGAKAGNVNNRFIIEHGFHSNTATAKWLYSDENLKKLAKAEAKVLADYFGMTKKEENFKQYIVRTTAESLNGRKGAGTSYDIECKLTEGTAVTIVEEKTVNGTKWLKTKSGYWISSKYTEFVRYV